MAVTKSVAPGNEPTKAATNTTEPTSTPTGQGTTPHPADATETQTHPERGYHDSLSGRPVDESGNFTDGGEGGPIPEHRIVADAWPILQDEHDARV